MSEFDVNATPQFDAMIGAVNQKHTEDEAAIRDERFIYFKTGNSYRVRLCWPIDPFNRRQSPWIFRVIHEDRGAGRTNTEITCPTSDYLMGRRGFRACKACECSGNFYNDSEKSKVSKELYLHFKRQYRYVAMVYVVSDSLTPKNNGKFMLMRVPKGIADYLNRRVFGWATKNGELPLPLDRVIGKSAFLTDNGYDLNIDVSTESTASGTFNSYSAEFMPQPTSVPVTQADINRAALELKFDEDFYKTSSQEEIENFVKTAIMGLKMEYEINGVPTDFDPSKLDQGNLSAANPNAGSSATTPPVMNGNDIPTAAVETAPQSAPATSATVTSSSSSSVVPPKGNTELDSVLTELGFNKK